MNEDIAASAERWLDLRFHNDNRACLEALRVRAAGVARESIPECLTEDLGHGGSRGHSGGGLPHPRVGLEARRAAAAKARRAAGTRWRGRAAHQAGTRVWCALAKFLPANRVTAAANVASTIARKAKASRQRAPRHQRVLVAAGGRTVRPAHDGLCAELQHLHQRGHGAVPP